MARAEKVIVKMKSALLLLTVLLTETTTVRATEALQNVDPPLDYGAISFDETGFSFRPATNITIEALGFAFSTQPLPASYVVRLLNHTGEVLTSAILSTSNAPGVQFVYTNIPPLSLAAGSTNFLTCYDAAVFATNGSYSWSGRFVNESDSEGGSFDVAPQLNYLSAILGTNSPSGTNNPSLLFVGPNFQFTVLETSRLTIALTLSNTALVSWPATDTLGQLQTAPDLATTMTNVTAVPTVVGPNKVVEWPITDTQAFFRLNYP